MFVRYIYIEQFENIIQNLNMNFKGRYNFNYDENSKVLDISKNIEYIEKFYNNYVQIDDVISIIGKNTSGKSSILRAMNLIWNEISNTNNYNDESIKFIAVLEQETELICYTNINEKIKILENKLISKKIKLIKLNSDTSKNEDIKTTFIYYSGIFDKNVSLVECDTFIDISTNNLVRESINETYTDKRKRWSNIQRKYSNFMESYIKTELDAQIELETDQFDYIDEFRKNELLKKMNYYNELRNKGLVKKNSLFDFPENLYISLADNFNLKDKFIWNTFNEKKEQDIMFKFTDLICEYTLNFQGDNYNKNDIKDNIIIQFALLIFYELAEYLQKVYDVNIIEIIDSFNQKIENQNISINIMEETLKKFKQEKITLTSVQYDHIKKTKEEKSLKLTIYKNLQILINTIDEEYFDEENRDKDKINTYSELENISEKVQFIIDNVSKIIVDIYDIGIENTNSIDDKERINKYKLVSFNDTGESIKECIESLQELMPNENYKTYEETVYAELLYDDSDNSEIFLEFISKVTDKLRLLQEHMIDKDEEEYVDDIKTVKNAIDNRTVYADSDEKVIEYVDVMLDIINDFKDIVKHCTIKKTAELIIETKWSNPKVLNFLEKFKKLKLTTFKIDYESEKLSSGQIVYFEMLYRLYYLSYEKKIEGKDIILMIDEGDIYMHPGVQIDFVTNMLEFIKTFLNNKKVQIIITSNSPFIISDIPNSKIIYIQKNGVVEINNDEKIHKLKTFGTPINDLLINNFFMDKGIVGKFAQKKITDIIDSLYCDNATKNIDKMTEQQRKRLVQVIDAIGDEIIGYKLRTRYEYITRKNKEAIKEQISYHEKIIDKLRKEL